MASFVPLLPLHLLFFSALFLFPLVLSASLPVGSSLTTDDEPWLSPSRDFAFGFHQKFEGAAYLLAIWYNKIADKTIVWYAGPPDNLTVTRGAKVDLTSDNGLVLSIPGNNNPTTISQLRTNGAASGFLNDTGNFVIRNSVSDVLWESFNHPTNTLLPGQILPKGGVLFSQRTETNLSRGRFELWMQPDGNFVGYTVNLETRWQYNAYYSTGTYDYSNSSNAGYQLVFNATAYLFVSINDGRRSLLKNNKVNSVTDYYHRATLDFDGVFTQYQHLKNSNNASDGDGWNPVWSLPDNICKNARSDKGGGPCGFNNVCILGQNQRATCQCPRGFSLLDPNDKIGSCSPVSAPDCETGNRRDEEFDLLELPNTKWPDRVLEELGTISEEDCRKACLSDCMCAVATFDGKSCSKMDLPVSNGFVESSFTGKSLVKIRKNYHPATMPNANLRVPGKNGGRGTLILVGSLLFGTSLFVNFLLILGLCTGFFFLYHKKLRANITKSDDIPDMNLRCFAYQELVDATEGFKEELGRGSFGIVYKGVLMRHMGSGRPVVAVKKLDRVAPQESEKEFKAEVNSIGQTHHKNLVRLLGFCNQGSQRLLVYEFLGNGTLAGFLFCDPKPSWTRRTQIPVGIARGLVYLHEECGMPIIHCDIKPHNILLDDDFNPRISDFGLAKLLMMNKSHTQTGIRGTKGYVAPEWFRNAQVTAKVDVYSFGVLLLEIVCSRRIWDVEIDGQNGVLIDWAYDCYREGILETLVESDEEAMNDWMKLERFVKVGLWCIQEDPSLRPTMRKVIQMLEGVVQVPVPPNPFPFGSSSVWNDEGDH